MNKVIILGNITKDIEIKDASADVKVANFDVAVPRQKKGEVDFIKCVAFNKTAETIKQYFGKGRQILITGHLQIDNYTAEDGTKKSMAKVMVETFDFLNGGKKDDAPDEASVNNAPIENPATQGEDLDLPF